MTDRKLYIHTGVASDAMQLAGAEKIRVETTALNKLYCANKAFLAMLEEMPSVDFPMLFSELSFYTFVEGELEPGGDQAGEQMFTRVGFERLSAFLLRELGMTDKPLPTFQECIGFELKMREKDAELSKKDAEIAELKEILRCQKDSTLAEANNLTVIPDQNDALANEAFEQWAIGERMDVTTHPTHWLFLNAETYAARQGWKAALVYARSVNSPAAQEL